MSSGRHLEKIASNAEQAVRQIGLLRLPFDPPMFELWFTYYSGENRNLCSAIHELNVEHKTPSYETLFALYQSFVSKTGLMDRVRDIGEGLRQQTRGTLGAITIAAEVAHSYRDDLAKLEEDFKKKGGSSGIGAAVTTLLKSTVESQRASAVLQRQLSESAEQIRNLQNQLDVVQRETLSDPLTGVANRRMFESSMCQLIEQADKRGEAISLILIDVDKFKYFNDRFGHQVGDDVLRLVSSVIKQTCRAGDVVCRYGGDEFAVILPDTPIEGALIVAEKVRQSVMNRQLLRRSTQEALGKMTISVGAAQYQSGETSETLVARADKWLYSAKRNGRNCVSNGPCPDENDVVDADRCRRGLSWSKAYECGDPLIDNEHRKLFALANSLFEPDLAPVAQPRELEMALDKLIDYVKVHFANEEAELDARNYTGLSWHKAAHANLLNDAYDLKAQVRSGRKTLGDLREFIVNEIVTQHMLSADKAFFPLFQSKSSTLTTKSATGCDI